MLRTSLNADYAWLKTWNIEKNIEKTIVYDKQSTLLSQNMTYTIIVSSYSKKKTRDRKIQIPRKIKILSSIWRKGAI